MKILYVNAYKTTLGWGAEHFMSRAFEKAEHQVVNVDYRVNRRRLPECFADVGSFNMLFLQRGDYFPRGMIAAIPGPRAFWASELISRNRDQDRLLRSGLFDQVYVHSELCRQTVIERGWLPANRVSMLLNGFEPATHRRLGTERDLDVLFVGNVTKRRRKILDRLEESLGSRLVVRQAYGEEHVQLINRSKLVLNIHADDPLDTETRVFEVLGAGGFLISETLSPENPFSDHHLVEVTSIDELKERIFYYLDHGEERETIAEAGHAEAHRAHTYDARALWLVKEWKEKFGAELNERREIGDLRPIFVAANWLTKSTGLKLYRMMDL